MSTNQNEKVDELITKLKSLGQRVKSSRDEIGTPLGDRLGTRLTKLLSRFPAGNGTSAVNQQPQEAKLVCPRCGLETVKGAHFCSGCGFDFEGEERRRQREEFEQAKIVRNGQMGIVF